MLAYSDILIRLILAAVLGAIVGLERERKNWAAGLRTHMLVCLGSALMMMVSSFGFSDILTHDHVTLDPSRVAAQVVSGIGFVGAGTILFLRQGAVKGLTTASGLWAVAGVGLACGGGLYFAAASATAFIFLILWAIQPLEKWLFQRPESKKERILKVTLVNNEEAKQLFSKLLAKELLGMEHFHFEKSDGEIQLEIKFIATDPHMIAETLDDIQHNPAFKHMVMA